MSVALLGVKMGAYEVARKLKMCVCKCEPLKEAMKPSLIETADTIPVLNLVICRHALWVGTSSLPRLNGLVSADG